MFYENQNWVLKKLRYHVVNVSFCPYINTLCFQCVFIMSVVNYSELDYKRPTKPLYKFPTWAVGVGWGMAAFAAIWIPLMILYRFYERGISKEVKKFKI